LILGVSLDCVETGVPWPAREIVADWAPGSRRAAAEGALTR